MCVCVRACVCIHVHTRACVRMRARACACEGTGAARVDPCRSLPQLCPSDTWNRRSGDHSHGYPTRCACRAAEAEGGSPLDCGEVFAITHAIQLHGTLCGWLLCCRAATVVVCFDDVVQRRGSRRAAHDSAKVCGYARSVGMYGSLAIGAVLWALKGGTLGTLRRYSGYLRAVLWVLKGGTLG